MITIMVSLSKNEVERGLSIKKYSISCTTMVVVKCEHKQLYCDLFFFVKIYYGLEFYLLNREKIGCNILLHMDPLMGKYPMHVTYKIHEVS